MSDRPEGSARALTGTQTVSAAQKRAAHAYADVLLEADAAGPAADDAIAAFQQALEQRGDIPGGPQSPAADETLLALARLMAAVSVPDRSLPADRRQAVWASIGATSHCTCRESAALLATRANGNIQPREATALDEHLAGCANCRELSVRTVAAEQAFRDELRPKGSGLPTLPRAAYAVLAVLVAVGVAVLALSTGSSHTHTTARAAAAIPTQTQAADTIRAATTTSQTTAAITKAERVRAQAAREQAQVRAKALAKRKLAARKRAAAKRKAALAAARASSHATVSKASPPATEATTPATEASSSGSEASSSGSEASSSGPEASSAASTPPTSSAPATSSAAAPSTAAAVSGQSSLPADSAPQQGIGTLTTQ